MGYPVSPPLARDFSRAESANFLRRSTTLGVLMFVLDLALYAVCLAGVIAGDPWWVRLPAALAAGVATALLFVVGHDACHQGLTPHRRLNGIVGRLAFLPALHPFSLWELGHNRTHHRYTNQRGKDYLWEPVSPAEYRALSRRRRWSYWFFRTPVGHLFYYLCVVWWGRMFFPRPSRVGGYRRVYAFDLALVCVGLVALPTAIWAARSAGGAAEWATAFGFGVLVPFLVYSLLMSFVIYLHHTHPEVPWYPPGAAVEWRTLQVRTTVHVLFPGPANWLFHRIMEHTAHHLRPSLPCYNLRAAQELLESHNDGDIVVMRWSPREHLRVLAVCKCFDPARGTWVGYDGKPSEPARRGNSLNENASPANLSSLLALPSGTIPST